MKRFEFTDETFEIGLEYFSRRIAANDFKDFERDINHVTEVEQLNKILFRLPPKDRARVKSSIHSIVRRKNTKNKNTTRLEVSNTVGDNVRKVAEAKNMSVDELLNDMLYTEWRHYW